MSTEFRHQQTDEWAFTRWASRPTMGVDFGSVERFDRIIRACMNDHDMVFVGETGEQVFGWEVVQLWMNGVFSTGFDTVPAHATFGEFCGTVEIGSGELFDRMGW